jgi:hypothetical protein
MLGLIWKSARLFGANYAVFLYGFAILSVLGVVFITGWNLGQDNIKAGLLKQVEESLEIQKKKTIWAYEEAQKRRLTELALEKQLSELEEDAKKDPVASRPAVSRDGVRRLNQIR